MRIEAVTKRGDLGHRVTLVRRRPQRKTALARRRRLNRLVRELARDLGFDLGSVTLAEHGVLQQCATLMLQVEVAQDELVGGAVVDADTCIRLTSEARRLLASLRRRAKGEAPSSPPWSPLRARLAAAAETPEAVPAKLEPAA